MRTIVLMLCLIVGATNTADALRCGSRVVSKGAHKTDVWHKCGEPISIEERVIYTTDHHPHRYYSNHRPNHRPNHRQREQQLHKHPRQVGIPITIEEWIYNFGPRRLMQKLQFENGKLVYIDSLGYGYLPR